MVYGVTSNLLYLFKATDGLEAFSVALVVYRCLSNPLRCMFSTYIASDFFMLRSLNTCSVCVAFPCAGASKLHQQKCISPGQSSKLTHTGVENDTCAFHPHGLSVVQCSVGHVIGIVFLDTISVA